MENRKFFGTGLSILRKQQGEWSGVSTDRATPDSQGSQSVGVGHEQKQDPGSFVAIVTPFNRDGSVDFSAFRSLLKFQEDHGTAAVLIMGSTGEVSLLSPEERRQVIVETAKMKTGKMQLFYGCTGNTPTPPSNT